MDIKDLKANTSVDLLEAEVIDIEEAREFSTFRGTGRVATSTIKDKSGEVKLTLWNDQIDQVSVGSKVKIENGWVKEYRGELQVSTGKFGTLSVIE